MGGTRVLTPGCITRQASPAPDVVRLLLSVRRALRPTKQRRKHATARCRRHRLHTAFQRSLRPSRPRAFFSNAERDPNRRNNDGDTPLHTAFTGVGLFVFSLGMGDSGVVGALLRGGAKPNTYNNDGDAPLILAVQRKRMRSCKIGARAPATRCKSRCTQSERQRRGAPRSRRRNALR